MACRVMDHIPSELLCFGRRAEFVSGGAIATGASGLSGIAASAEVVCDGLRVICCQSVLSGQWGFSCGLAFPVANAAEFRLGARCPGHRACRRLSGLRVGPAGGLDVLVDVERVVRVV